MNRSLKIAITSLIFNIVFSIYYLIVSIYTKSWWLLVLGVYYLILSAVKAFVLKSKKINIQQEIVFGDIPDSRAVEDLLNYIIDLRQSQKISSVKVIYQKYTNYIYY